MKAEKFCDWYYVGLAFFELMAVLTIGAMLLWRIGSGRSPDLLTDLVLLMLLLGARWEPSAKWLRRRADDRKGAGVKS
jgi:hypothetical protein